MDLYIMKSISSTLDSKIYLEKRKLVLFWYNFTCHPETLQTSLAKIKIAFLPKHTTPQLQPLNAGIIRNFKHKYRKQLVRYVDSGIDEGKTTSQITEDVHVLRAITWISNRLEKCIHGDHHAVI